MSWARALLRSYYRGRTIRRRLPARFGSSAVHVAPESSLRHVWGGEAAFDPHLLRWAAEHVKPGDAVWDIGANVGVFAFAAAACGASVLAVEPDPFLANALLRSKGENPRLAVDLMIAAISDQRSIATLHISDAGRSSNALGGLERPMYGNSLAQMHVPTVTLDDLLQFSTPKFVKIDVEGAEAAVMAGATRVLAEARPVMVVEVGSECASAVGDILRRNNYAMFDAENANAEVAGAVFNTLAIPSETLRAP